MKKPKPAFGSKEHNEISAKKAAKKSRRRKMQAERARHWYEENKARILAYKKKKYAEDPVYKARVIASVEKRRQRMEKARNDIRSLKPNHYQGKGFRRKGNLCRICRRRRPKLAKATTMLVEGRYEVRMYTFKELARAINRHWRTIRHWIEKGLLPPAPYRAANASYWTEDQVEALTDAFRRYDTSVSKAYKLSGLHQDVEERMKRLEPLGIDTKVYLPKDNGRLARPPKGPRAFRLPKDKTQKVCPDCGRPAIPLPRPRLMLVGSPPVYETRMYTQGHVARLAGRNTFTLYTWRRHGLIPQAIYTNSRGHQLWTEDQIEVFREGFKRFSPRGYFKIDDHHALGAYLTEELNKLLPHGINPEHYTEATDRGTYARPKQKLAA